jgi:hypothetical protein
MNNDKLIRLGDARDAVVRSAGAMDAVARINALPAVQPAPDVAGLVEAANKAAIVLAEHEPHPLPVLIELLTALAALEDRG